MAYMQSLPTELISYIMSFVDSPKSLAALNQTCKQFKDIANEALYESAFIAYKREQPFKRALEAKPGRKNLVKELYVDCLAQKPRDDPIISACTYAHLYAEFPNLEELKLKSKYWYWNDRDCDRRDEIRVEDWVNWEWDQSNLASRFDRAGLQRPPETRIWTKLKSCILDFRELNGQGWLLDDLSPGIFLMASLEELTLLNCRLVPNDGAEIPHSPFRGQTPLRKLILSNTYTHHKAVENILSGPKALMHLTLDFWPDMMHPHTMAPESAISPDRELWMQILGQQKHSLERLVMSEQLCDELCEEENDFRDFAMLKRVEYDGMVYHVTDDEVDESEREQCFNLDGGWRYGMEYKIQRSEMYAIGLAG